MSQASSSTSVRSTVGLLAEVLREASELLQSLVVSEHPSPLSGQPGAANLLWQCMELCERHNLEAPEPVRTVHHFACSGGTLISRCIAALPNVQLLSEVDPLAMQQINLAKPRFAPTDMVTLLHQSTRGTSQDLLVELFQASLRVVVADATKRGQRLVIRDHAHTQFCLGREVVPRPSLLQIVAGAVPVRSVLTVRHPLDSFASLVKNGWVHFTAPTLDEYSRRYLAFLNAHEGMTRVRYEDFTASPQEAMRDICAVLDLPYVDNFVDLFSVFNLSGDSGRSGNHIAPRVRRAEATALLDGAERSESYRQLTKMLGYESEGSEDGVSQ